MRTNKTKNECTCVTDLKANPLDNAVNGTDRPDYAYVSEDYATDPQARDPQNYARACDFPELENAMPKSKPSMIASWGWGVLATALSFGLIMFVTLGGTQ